MPIPLTCLVIFDGFGANPIAAGNAILSTTTPNFDYLWNNYPHTLLKAAEEEVGLNFGEMGNSEVGHLIIGSGRVLYQSLQRINQSLDDQSFYNNPAFLEAINHAKQNNSALHLLGMVSVAGVHAHLNHFLALLALAANHKLKKVYLHVILDGRDSGPKDASIFITKINDAIKKYKTGSIASIHGRAYAMDRNENWERNLLSLNVLLGKTNNFADTPVQAVEAGYAKNLDDESLWPTLINKEGYLKDNDALIFTNYREDRARQLTHLLTNTPTITHNSHPMPVTVLPADLKIITMTQYDQLLPTQVAFPPEHPQNTLSDALHNLGIHQTHISETEKYAHVSYFFNGGRETPHPDETMINLPSPPPETFVTNPQMAAPLVLKQVLETINTKPNEFIVVNFANPDMVGHTGNFEATKQAVSLMDQYISQIHQAIMSKNGYLFITADHGNAESKIDPATGNATKDHTSNPVPFIAISNSLKVQTATNDRITTKTNISGILADVAPTILSLLNLPIPAEMTGTPLFANPEMPQAPLP